MKAKLTIIVLTAIATTLAWAFVIAAFFWLATDQSPSGRVQMEFLRAPGTVGAIEMLNPKTQDVVIAIEQLPTGNGTSRVQLLREPLSAGGRVRIGVREVAENVQ